MPTAKPRITITLTDHQHAVLSSLSHLQKTSMSSIVVDLLDTTLPVLERLAGVLHNAATAPQTVLDEIRRSAQQAEHDVSHVQGSMLDVLDSMLEVSAGTLRDARGGACVDRAERSVPADAGSGEPPTSNRGVRITSPRSKIGSISPMKMGEKNGRAGK